MEVLILYNEPALPADDPDWAAEIGVLDSVESVSSALLAHGHMVRKLGLGSSTSTLLDALAGVGQPDVVFNLFEGLGGVSRGESEVAGMIELLGFPLTGCPAECLALVRDKARTKWLLLGAGLPTPRFLMIRPDDSLDEGALHALLAQGPVIVKPAHEDASLGVDSESIVTEWEPLVRRVEYVRGRYGAVLVEQFVVGREFNAAVIALDEPECLALAEIEFSGPGAKGWQIVTYDAKWAPGSSDDVTTPARCPARVDTATARRIEELAVTAFRLTGCRDYARVDLRMDGRGQIFVLEVNANPDIGPTAGFAPALAVSGVGYDEFVDRIVRTALANRSQKQDACDRVG